MVLTLPGTEEVRVTVNNGPPFGALDWTVTSDSDWATVVSSASGTGSTTVRVSVDPNTGGARVATITVSAPNAINSPQLFYVDQSAAISQPTDASWPEGPIDWPHEYADYHSANEAWSYNVTAGAGVPIRAGSRSERFELRHGDCGGADCQRVPVARERSMRSALEPHSRDGDEHWYGFSFYVPSDYVDCCQVPGTNGTVTLFQFIPSPTFEPIFMFDKATNQGFVLRAFPPGVTDRVELIEEGRFRGRWHDFVIHARRSASTDGFLHVWVNNELRYSYEGPTWLDHSNDYVYSTYGLYRPSDTSNPTTGVA